MSVRSVRQKSIRTSSEEDLDLGDQLIKINRTQYNPSPKQQEIHVDMSRTKIIRGGLGSGKTRLACEHMNNLCLAYPGSVHFVCREDMTTLKETTQKEYLENVVDSALVETFNVNDNKLYYKNGSQVLFRETKKPAKAKSTQITSYLIDEADENPTPQIWEFLDQRMRQKLTIDGKEVIPPYSGMLVFNPCDERHWLYSLAHRKDIDVRDFQLSSYDNQQNLPPDYIPNLLKTLAPWDVARLVHGDWGSAVRGRPVYHGFNRMNNVRPLRVNPDWPLLVGWDFGYMHPAIRFAQIDVMTGRMFILREYQGNNQKLADTATGPGVVTAYRNILAELIGATNHPVFHYGDPHGNDEKDTAESSIEYLRIHHGIHIMSRRERVKTGMDEIQHKISTMAPYGPPPPPGSQEPWKEESLFLVDPSCKITITAYEGGYHRDEMGAPVKDGIYDHLPDTDRYLVINTMHRHLEKRLTRKGYRPKSMITGY